METLDDARHIEGRDARWGEWMGILLGELSGRMTRTINLVVTKNK